MKIGFIGDLHFRLTESIPIRLKDKLKNFREAVKLVNEKADVVVLLGDIFDYVNVSERLKKAFWDILSILKDKKIRIILGNHDLGIKSHNFLSDIIWTGSSNLEIINKPFVEEFEIDSERVCIGYCRYIKEESFGDVLSFFKEKEVDLLVLHEFIKGSKITDQIVSNTGVPLRSLSSFRKVYVGHIHKFQIMGNVVILGSNSKQSFRDKDEKSFISILDLHNFSEEFIEIADRAFVDVNINLDERTAEDFSFPENAIVRLIFQGSFDRFKLVDVNKIKSIAEKRAGYVITKFDLADRKEEIKSYSLDNLEELLFRKVPKDYLPFGKKILAKAQEKFEYEQ